jgi:hypothetical protein
VAMAYTYNCTQCYKEQVPLFCLLKKPVSIGHLKVVGCKCYATVSTGGEKLSVRAKQYILVRYNKNPRGYRLWDTDTNRIVVSRNVTLRRRVV